MKLSDSIKQQAKGFGLTEEEGSIPGIDKKFDHEKETINKLERSAKFDEIDTVAFGLETDDNKIVKVYVKADQAENFERELSTKLGEIDDIEEVLNALAKDFEIVDVDWPDEEESSEDEEDVVGDGSEIMDKKVYKKDQNDEDDVEEGLTFGDELGIKILESGGSSNSIENRFTTPAQLLVYHAIIDLGVPEIALARNSYRASIIKGIKERAVEIQKTASLKTALKTFIKRVVNYDDLAKDHEEKSREEASKSGSAKHEVNNVKESEKEQEMKILVSEEKIDWDFSVKNDELTIACNSLNITIDQEETEKVIKGLTNRDAVVVKDVDDQKKRVVFSPRASNVLVKRVGSAEGYMMSAKDIDDLLAAIAPEKKKVEEELEHTDIDEAIGSRLVGKYMKEGKRFYLWQKSEGGYSYVLTKHQSENFDKVKGWDLSLDEVKVELKKEGYEEK